jgi:hypothetical protein
MSGMYGSEVTELISAYRWGLHTLFHNAVRPARPVAMKLGQRSLMSPLTDATGRGGETRATHNQSAVQFAAYSRVVIRSQMLKLPCLSTKTSGS